jgi:adenine-specific DNA-methyltransferase
MRASLGAENVGSITIILLMPNGTSNAGVVHSSVLGSAVRFWALIRELRALMARRHVSAERVLLALVGIVTQERAPGVGSRWLGPGRVLAKAREVIGMANLLKPLDFDAMTYGASTAYALLCSDDIRHSQAMFFTPPALTGRLLDELERNGVDYANSRFMDPACGGAAFLVPIARRIIRTMKNDRSAEAIATHLATHLYGMELDPVLARLCRHFLEMQIAIELGIKKSIGVKIRTGNALTNVAKWRVGVDVIVCNPPYRKLNGTEQDAYRQKYKDILSAQSNLYALFMGLCVDRVECGGLIGLVTPANFLTGQSFSNLREKLIRDGNVRHIGILSDRGGVFMDAQMETAVTVIERRTKPRIGDTTATVGIIERDGSQRDVGVCSIPDSGRAWPIPREKGDVALIQSMAKSGYRLADFGYEVRIGLIVWNRDKRRTFMTDAKARRAGKDTYVPLFWASDVTPGKAVRLPTAFKDGDEARFVKVGDRALAPLIRNAALVMQRVTNNHQKQRLIASPVPKIVYKKYGGFVGENHTVILEATGEPAVTPDELAELLATRPLDRYYRCISGSSNVSVFELSQLPLPNPKRLRILLTNGLAMEQAALAAYQ